MVLLALVTPAASWREAMRLLGEQRRKHRNEQGEIEEAAVPSYRAAIRSCGEAGKWQQAITVLRQLEADGARTDTYCYSEAMAACRKHGQWLIALTLLDDLRAKNVRPDVFTTSNGIAACEPGRQWKRALAILRAQQEPKPNTICYNSAMSVCSAAAAAQPSAWREALKLLEELEEMEDAQAHEQRAQISQRPLAGGDSTYGATGRRGQIARGRPYQGKRKKTWAPRR